MYPIPVCIHTVTRNNRISIYYRIARSWSYRLPRPIESYTNISSRYIAIISYPYPDWSRKGRERWGKGNRICGVAIRSPPPPDETFRIIVGCFYLCKHDLSILPAGEGDIYSIGSRKISPGYRHRIVPIAIATTTQSYTVWKYLKKYVRITIGTTWIGKWGHGDVWVYNPRQTHYALIGVRDAVIIFVSFYQNLRGFCFGIKVCMVSFVEIIANGRRLRW